MKENFDRCVAEEKEGIKSVSMEGSGRGKHRNPLRQVKHRAERVFQPAIKLTPQAGRVAIQPSMTLSKHAGNAMKRLGIDKHHTASMDSMAASERMTGFDELEDGFQWRDEGAFIQNFMYSMRKDHSVSLPAVLAKGLDKRLSDTTHSKAVDIIEDLTSPLFSHRKSSYDERHQVRPIVTSLTPRAAEPASPQKASFFASLFGTPTPKSSGHENDASASIQAENRDCEDSKTAPVERLTLLDRSHSHSSLMTTESTDNHAWLRAGSLPALGKEDQGNLFQTVVVGEFGDQFVNY
jgi:hypothetical protein